MSSFEHLLIDPDVTAADPNERRAIADGSITLPGRNAVFRWPHSLLNESGTQPKEASKIAAQTVGQELNNGWMLITNQVVSSERGLLVLERALDNHAGVYSTLTEQANSEDAPGILAGRTIKPLHQFTNPETNDTGIVLAPDWVDIVSRPYDKRAAVAMSGLTKIGVDPKHPALETSYTSLMTLRPGKSTYTLRPKDPSPQTEQTIEAEEWSLFATFATHLSDPDMIGDSTQYGAVHWIDHDDYLALTATSLSEEEKVHVLRNRDGSPQVVNETSLHKVMQRCVGGQCTATAEQSLKAGTYSTHINKLLSTR